MWAGIRACAGAARRPRCPPPLPGRRRPGRAAIGVRRRWIATLLALTALPALTLALTSARADLTLADDLLLYLLVVVAVSVIGGFWPAVLTATASGLLLNWYLTPPLHTFTIERPENLLALLLFIAVAMIVSSIVHLAARRAEEATRSSSDAAALLELARTVLRRGYAGVRPLRAHS